jgi:hypothetical protein
LDATFPPATVTMLEMLNNPLFWHQKVRITILTLATFAALC